MWSKEKQEEMATRLGNLIEELVRTERSYLMRIQALKKVRHAEMLEEAGQRGVDVQNYADPLRNFARQEFSKIIPMYEAKTLFTNIDAIVPSAAAFLQDLEKMHEEGSGPSTIGDVCLRHVRRARIGSNGETLTLCS
jgi:hypothetical protein